MRILIAGWFSSAAALVLKLAENNPSVLFDFIGLDCTTFDRYPNIKKINAETSRDIIEHINRTHSVYDFIYANDDAFQLDENFSEFKKSCSIPILSPSIESFQLEKSKLFCKSILNSLDIPTPKYRVIENDLELIENQIAEHGKVVLKLNTTRIATGYATWIAKDATYIKWLNSVKISDPFEIIFMEEYIQGKEISFHILSNGDSWVYLGSARDYKKIYDNDEGINCTSAGCYNPVEYLDSKTFDIISSYVDKIISYQHSQNTPYIGIMYIGIIIDRDNVPYILEINTRPGNPEFASLLPRIKSNLLEPLICAAARQPLQSLEFNSKCSIAIQLLHTNYSWKHPDHIVHPKLDDDDNILIFNMKKLRLLYNARSCLITTGDDLISAKSYLYEYLKKQDLGTYRYRSDIGTLI